MIPTKPVHERLGFEYVTAIIYLNDRFVDGKILQRNRTRIRNNIIRIPNCSRRPLDLVRRHNCRRVRIDIINGMVIVRIEKIRK
jgi:hypothetical protein